MSAVRAVGHPATAAAWEWLERSHLLELDTERYKRIREQLVELDRLLYKLDEETV